MNNFMVLFTQKDALNCVACHSENLHFCVIQCFSAEFLTCIKMMFPSEFSDSFLAF